SAPPGDPSPLAGMVWALSVGIVTLWLDGPLEGRCVSLGTTPEELTSQITALLETLLTADPSRHAPAQALASSATPSRSPGAGGWPGKGGSGHRRHDHNPAGQPHRVGVDPGAARPETGSRSVTRPGPGAGEACAPVAGARRCRPGVPVCRRRDLIFMDGAVR